MNWFFELPSLIPYALLFALVLCRVSGLMISAPIYGGPDIPMPFRVFLAIALSLLVTPLQLRHATAVMPATIVDLLLSVGAELLVGLTLGAGIQLILAGVQIAGQIISQLSGMSLGDVFNPALDSSIPLFSHLLYLFALAIFVCVGGHRLVLGGLLDTFAFLPPGAAEGMTYPLFETIVGLIEQSFLLGIRSAAPATVALLLATLVLGLISRTLPQLNVMAVGFGINVCVTMLTLAVSLSGIAWLLHDSFEPALASLIDALRRASG